jgi:hypothetical protein
MEIIADNLKKAGWSLGCFSAIDSNGRTIWIADAHRGNGKRFVVRAVRNLARLWNSNQRFALAANCFNSLARFSPNSAASKKDPKTKRRS